MSEYEELILKEVNEWSDPELAENVCVPRRTEIVDMIKCAQVVLFPAYFHYREYTQLQAFHSLSLELEEELKRTYCLLGKEADSSELSRRFLSRLPEVKKLLLSDVQAIYDGDPAAVSKAEVVLCYPGFYAITIYRLAHELYTLEVPYIPRVMTEYAHEKTGIDINPGASIGSYFCIDHGTGIVIGETAVIGSHVKLYQGVTIGAKSFELDENGFPVKGGKRHPDIHDHVTIYANATILGGKTIIGERSTIGGNVWITSSVKAGETITYSSGKQNVLPEKDV